MFLVPDLPIQNIWMHAFDHYASQHFLSEVQLKASRSILCCKTGSLGFNVSQCLDCGHLDFHNNSCRNRNCPNCQAVKKELWVDKRRAEVIDSPYFHVVFTLPHELNSLLYCNQSLLYALFHKACAQTLLELAQDKKYLGATPGIIQVLHTWNQELNYHIHMHCIVSGGGISTDKRLRKSGPKFFIPVFVLRDKFKGKFMALLKQLYLKRKLRFSISCAHLSNIAVWNSFCNSLYEKQWCPYIKQTFNGFGNAIEYLGKYTHKIAISNSRIFSVSNDTVSFSARGIKPGDPRRIITLTHSEFIRRFLLHVLPSGFQKIRYYGFLSNRCKMNNLRLIFTLQGHQRFKARFSGLSMAQLLKAIWKIDISVCSACGCRNMIPLGRSYAPS